MIILGSLLAYSPELRLTRSMLYELYVEAPCISCWKVSMIRRGCFCFGLARPRGRFPRDLVQ
jgi:hypothetical protein